MFKFCTRRIGFELEYNSFDKMSKSVDFNNLPNGIYYYGQKISECLRQNVEVCKWQSTNNNTSWIVKPDASCGLEVCTPPNNHMVILPQLSKVIKAMHEDCFIQSDLRCSFHIHVEIADFDDLHILNIVEKWINFEHFFFFITESNRWFNRYCKPLGFYYGFDNKKILNSKRCIEILSANKYFAINFYHYSTGSRKTIEFRIVGSNACLNDCEALNWSKLILCFVDRCKGVKRDSNLVTDFSYKDLDEIYEFLDLDNYFETDEIKQWLYAKFSRLLENKIDVCEIWKKILLASTPSIEKFVHKLNGDKNVTSR